MEVKEEIKYKVGTMTKDPFYMNEEELAEWEQECADDAREYLFSIGQPLVYRREDGRFVAEFEDGRIELVR